MEKHILDIEGFIGGWGYSKSFIKNFLQAAGKNPVTIRVSSLGGDVDHAIAIHNQFVEHGDVTVILTAFNASSATLITLGARRIQMHSNSFYLIHKALQWVDNWGNMNEDDLDALILSLEKEKNELQKITLVLAKMYARRTGKPTTEILDLMKQETWLTAEEALSWGFIDEIIDPQSSESPLTNQKLVTMLNCANLPVPPRAVPPISGQGIITPEPSKHTVLTDVYPLIRNTVNQILSMKNLTALNSVLGVPSLESSGEGTYLNQEQLSTLNEHLEANQQIVTEREDAIRERTTVLSALDAMDPIVASAPSIETKIEAIRTLLAAKPAVAPSGVKTASDKTPSPDGVDWELLNSLPHMQEDRY